MCSASDRIVTGVTACDTQLSRGKTMQHRAGTIKWRATWSIAEKCRELFQNTAGKNHDSSVGIALDYGLDNRGPRVRFPAGAGNFSLHHRVQNGSGAHTASYPMGTRGSFPGGKAARAWSWPLASIQCRGEKMSGTIPPLTQYAFMAWCSVKAQGQLYLLPLPYTPQKISGCSTH
jgi:hypothetical protein